VGFADAEHLLSVGLGGVLRRWQLDPERPGDVTELWSRQGAEIILLELAPGGRFVALDDSHTNKVVVVPLDGSAAPNREPAHLPSGTLLGSGPSWDPSGRSLAMSVFSWGHPELNAIHVFDRTTGTERVLETQPTGNEGCAEPGSQHAGGAAPVWLRDGRLLSEGDGGLRVWDLLTGTSRQLRPCRAVGSLWSLLATPDSRAVIRLDASGETAAESSLSVFDLSSGATREIASHGGRVSALASDPSGAILVTGDKNGIVRVGSLAGDEPHLLFGHTAAITSVAVSPDGRRIASGSEDGTIRLWPMPDLSRPPLHTLPHAELLAKLRSLTNLRAVHDPSSDTGWKVEIDAFPGWANVPEW
jgi:WD40 repeat protein